MRILHVGKFFPPFMGGMETFLADLLPALTQLGTECAALVHDHEHSEHGVEALERYASLAFIRRVPAFKRVLFTPISPRFPFWLAQAIKDFQPDILHLHLPNPSAFWVMALPAARRIPWVIHWHADVISSQIETRLALAYRLYRPFEQRLLELAHRVIVTSPPYLEASQPLQPWRHKCQIIPLGLDPARLKHPSPAALAWANATWGAAPVRILAAGRITYYKGYEYLIQAATLLDQGTILIVGGGEGLSELEQLAATSNGKVRLLGRRAGDELAALLATCDLFCLPSIERSEAFGMVLLEAMSQGKPITASAIPGSGVGWVVQDGQTGLLFPPADPVALATTLQTLINDPTQRARLGQAGEERFSKQFQIIAIAQQTKALYTTCLQT